MMNNKSDKISDNKKIYVLGDKIPILMFNGDMNPINELKNQLKNKSSLDVMGIDKNYNYINLKIKKIEQTTNDDHLVLIKTEKGRRLYCLENQIILSYNGRKIVLSPVNELKPIDNLVIPRNLPIIKSDSIIKFNLFSILPDHYLTVNKSSLKAIKKSFEQIITKINPSILIDRKRLYNSDFEKHLKYLSSKLNLKPNSLFKIYNEKISPSLNVINILQKETKNIIPIDYIHPSRSDKPVMIPTSLNILLSEFLGLHYAEGLLRDGHIAFANEDRQILDRWKYLAEKLFGSNLNFYTQKTFGDTLQISILSKTIQDFLEGIGVHVNSKEAGVKALNASIPSCILQAPPKLQLHFLNGFIAGDGSFNLKNKQSGTVVLHSSSVAMIYGFCSILAQMGILFTINHRPESEYHIRGKSGKSKKSYRILIHNEEIKKFLLYFSKEVFMYGKTQKFIDFLPMLDKKKTKKKNEYTIWFHQNILKDIKGLIHYTTENIHDRVLPYNKRNITAAQLQVGDCLGRPIRKTKRRGFTKFMYNNLYHLLGNKDQELLKTLKTIEHWFFDTFYLDIITEITKVTEPQMVYTIELDKPALALIGGETLTFHT